MVRLYRRRKCNPAWAATIFLYSVSAVYAQNAQFVPLGFLPGTSWTEAYAVSADGAVVVGRALGGGRRAFRWTSATGIQALANLPGRTDSMAWGISADGGTTVGDSETANSVQGCRWNAAGQMQLLGGLPGFSNSSAAAVTPDGAVIVGGSENAASEAVRWTAGGVQGIGDLPGQSVLSAAYATSADGSVIVGFGQSSSGIEAFRWTASSGMTGLGDIVGGAFYSTALSASSDGAVVVGWANGLPGPGAQAFRWTHTGGMQGLGVLPGANSSVARGVSGDGEIVIGASNFFGGRAFFWSSTSGMIDLKPHLIALGASGLDGWMLEAANAISQDGRYIVGQGTDPAGRTQAFLAILPIAVNCPSDLDGDGTIGLQDLAILLAHFGQIGDALPAEGDLDADGNVDLQDLASLLSQFGGTC